MNWLNQSCKQVNCDFNNCDPAWLCNNSDSIFGVSQLTSIPSQQLATTEKNAKKVLGYLSRSQVEDQTYRVQSTGQYQNWQYKVGKSKVEMLEKFSDDLLLRQICHSSTYLFAEYQLPKHYPPQLTG